MHKKTLENIFLRMRALPILWLCLCVLTDWMKYALLISLKYKFSLSLFLSSYLLQPKLTSMLDSKAVALFLRPSCRKWEPWAWHWYGQRSSLQDLHPPLSSLSTIFPCPYFPVTCLYLSLVLPHPACSQEIFNKWFVRIY